MPIYRHGKQTEPIEFESFKKIIREGKFTQQSHKSFLAFLFWFGVRKSEALERIREDFAVKNGMLLIKCPAKKRGRREKLQAPIDLPFMDLILRQIELTPLGRRVWAFSGVTAWQIVKRVMPKHYPHFFRLNRAVHFLDDPTTTLPEMQSWFGWREIKSINSYLGFSKRHLERQAKRLRQEVGESLAKKKEVDKK